MEWISELSVLFHTWITSAVIQSVSGDLHLFSFSIEISTSIRSRFWY